MSSPPLIVLSFEGLATAALGCYGSSWNQTPAIDAIAGSGIVWDRCIAASDEPLAVLQQIINPVQRGEAEIRGESNWADLWRQRGSVELLTDVHSLDSHSANCFDRICTLQFDPSRSADSPVSEIDQSQLGQLFAAAIERDNEDEPWSVLWLHSGFLTRCWDAPRELFSSDEVDNTNAPPSEDEVELLSAEPEPRIPETLPPIFDTVVPPQIKLETPTHPDLVNSWMRTYGCQVRLLDLLIEVLLGSLSAADPYVVIMGTSGFRLGQGGWIGHRPNQMRSPDIHLPMIVSNHGPLRIPHVTSSIELSNVLRTLGRGEGPLIAPERWSEAATDARVETRSTQSQFAVTTSGWYCVRDKDSSEHLFLKPDDVHDFNDVGRLRDDVVEELSRSKK